MQRADSVAEARELVRSLAAREIRSQYKGTLGGWVWSLLNPLALVATYTVVFGVLFRVEPAPGDPSGLQNYTLYLICGLIPWNLFAATVNGTTGSLLAQSSLISKVYFPRSAVVVAKALAVAFSSLIEFAVVVIILLIAGNMVLPWLPVLAGLFVVRTGAGPGLRPGAQRHERLLPGRAVPADDRPAIAVLRHADHLRDRAGGQPR